jgi:hypothetical protein
MNPVRTDGNKMRLDVGHACGADICSHARIFLVF